MKRIPWTKGRLALLGDAAHPFTPRESICSFNCSDSVLIYYYIDQGQGAGQAIEDAATLSVVLATGTTPTDVPTRLKLYEEIRSKRAHTIQEFSRRAGKDAVDGAPQLDCTALSNHDLI